MNLLDIIKAKVGEENVNRLSNNLGEDQGSTLDAISKAVPLLVSAMARNTRSEDGANALAGALDRDHDGSILENLGGLIDRPEESDGQGILKHVLGGKREVAEKAVAEKSGISMESAMKIFQVAAPIVMGMLGKKKKEENLSGGGLASILGSMASSQESDSGESGSGSGIGSMITGLLDRDGDGSVMDDIGGMIGGFLSNRS